MVEVDFGKVGADVFGVTIVDMLPSKFHTFDFFVVVEVFKEGLFELFRGRTGNHAGDVHVGVTGASETKIDKADNFIVFVKKNVAKVEVAVDEFLKLGFFDVVMVGVDVVVIMFIV